MARQKTPVCGITLNYTMLYAHLLHTYSIHEFNQNDILACFLPYHESSVFAKMVMILSIRYAFALDRNNAGLNITNYPQSILNMGLPSPVQGGIQSPPAQRHHQ